MRIKRVILPLVVLLSLLYIGATKSDFTLVRDTEIVINILRALNENYVDSLSTSQLLKDATAGIARNLDPYTSYIDEKEMSDFEIMTTGKYGGIGAIIRQKEDYVMIAQPYKGSPADEGGLRVGDKILAIDGEDAKGLTTEQVSSRLKGTPGSKVKVNILSVIDSTKRDITLRRRRISIPAVPYYTILDGGVGYLKHTDFTDGGVEEIRSALLDLRSKGMQSLILDYRDNGGGVMQEAIDILSLFLPKGSEVLKIKGRNDSLIYRTNETPLFAELPLAVLVNENSASASEIVAGALQDLDRAVLLGQKSFGKGLVQSTVFVGYDSYLKLTTARYYIPSGRSIQAIDYTDHSDGRRAERVADSLKREFLTRGGRKVFDGGGVTPDIELEVEYYSRFASRLYSQGLVDEWCEGWFRQHYNDVIDTITFDITDSDYQSFATFIKGRDVEYESRVSRAMTALQKAAKEDRNEELEELIEGLKSQIEDDIESNLDRYKEEVIDYIRHDLLIRFAYQEGALANHTYRDKEIARAREILTTQGEVERLLSPTTEQQTK